MAQLQAMNPGSRDGAQSTATIERQNYRKQEDRNSRGIRATSGGNEALDEGSEGGNEVTGKTAAHHYTREEGGILSRVSSDMQGE